MNTYLIKRKKFFMLNSPGHSQNPVTKNDNIRSAALALMGLFIGALIFILGVTVGTALARPGGLLFTGASPFPPSTGGSGQNIGAPTVSEAGERRGRVDTALMDNVLQRLKTQWYGELPTDDKLTDGAIRGMVNSLGDQFTQYVEPKYARILNDDINGAFDGIGATLKQLNNGDVQIVRTITGTPAFKGGIEAGDIIEAVDGKRVNGLSTSEVAAMVRGERGTTVKLTIRREGRPKPFDINLVRARIEVPLVTSKMVGKDNNIGYISLFQFDAPANEQLTKQLDALLKKNPKGLIFDLRDNPGGLLTQAQQVGDLFLKKGVFVIERDYKGGVTTLETGDSGMAQDIPLVILVNAGSASASEIVAGAIQDYGRGKLIGETTFGKGSVQSPQMLPNGGQLRITVQRWYTPKDRGIHGTGIAPDFVVVNTPADTKANKDPQLDAAIEYLATGKAPK
jgi:carboxyl-terminal processing protease